MGPLPVSASVGGISEEFPGKELRLAQGCTLGSIVLLQIPFNLRTPPGADLAMDFAPTDGAPSCQSPFLLSLPPLPSSSSAPLYFPPLSPSPLCSPPSFFSFFLVQFLEIGSHCVAQAGLEFTTFLTQPLKSWGYRCGTSGQALYSLTTTLTFLTCVNLRNRYNPNPLPHGYPSPRPSLCGQPRQKQAHAQKHIALPTESSRPPPFEALWLLSVGWGEKL